MKNQFFTKPNCDRCKKSLENKSRTLSWFNDDVICQECSNEERQIKQRAKQNGVNPDSLEGIGYVPKY